MIIRTVEKNIAVIIPVYNGADMLEPCIKSVVAAGKRIAEIIIVDDGSTDGSFEKANKLAEYDSRIKVIHTENHGSYMARVTGIKAATVSYIAFIDVDDRYYPGALDLLADLLEENNADIVMGGIVETTKYSPSFPERTQGIAEIRIQSPGQMWPRIMKWKTQEFLFYIWHKLYKRELFEGLPVVDHICQGDDVILTCRAFLGAKRIVETSTPVYQYYINPKGLTHKAFSDSDFDLIRVWDTVVDMMDKEGTDQETDLPYFARYNRWRTDFTLITRLLLSDDKTLDRKHTEDLKKWRRGLRRHWKDLVLPHAMPKNRELLIIGLRFFFTPTKILMRLGRRFIRENTGVLMHSGDKGRRRQM